MRHVNSYPNEGKDNIIKRVRGWIAGNVRNIKTADPKGLIEKPVSFAKYWSAEALGRAKNLQAADLSGFVRRPVFIATLLGLILLNTFIWVMFINPLRYNFVYPGITVDGNDVSGMSREELAAFLEELVGKYRAAKVTFYYQDKEFPITADRVELISDKENVINLVWNYGRQGTWWERRQVILEAQENGYSVSLKLSCNENKLNCLLEEIKEKIDKKPRNASYSLASGSIIEGEEGYSLDGQTLTNLYVEGVHKGNFVKLALPVVAVKPEFTKELLQQMGIKETVAAYSTYFNDSDVNRTTNVKLASQKINGRILKPGQNFSFNDVVGPREKANGFKEALEIVNGELVPGVGGGVCQVSSTLYNAVLLANLGINERANHCKPLGYIPLGRDATVAYGAIDFKFSNNMGNNIMIVSEVEGNKLTVGIAGTGHSAETVEIVTSVQREIAPETVKKIDKDMYFGDTVVESKGKPGYEVWVTRVIKQGGNQVSQELISKDIYLPDNSIVKVGTKPKNSFPHKRHGLFGG